MTVSSVFRLLCIATCAFMVVAARADPPGRVGRLTYLEGEVSFYSDDADGWRKAQINYPVTNENSIWTDGIGRAEVRIGPSAIRIGDDTVFDFVKLQDDIALGFLQRGSINVRIRQFGSLDAVDRLQIDTNEGRVILEGNGRYHIEASVTGAESRITVFSGTARFQNADREGERFAIDAGKRLIVRVINGVTDFRYDNAVESPFDRWAQSRDQQWDQTHIRYADNNTRETLISPYMTGYEDLDSSGDWSDDNEFGRLWTPRVVITDWAPYRYGRWSFVRPWGWTWIDDAAWGFAPFHYGRWLQVRSRWCWWPGPYIGRPVYAPALVAWLGSPVKGFIIGSGPAVGWFPLAPHEFFVPAYSSNAGYLRRLNQVPNNTGNIHPPTRFRNQIPGATIVANNVFVNGNSVGSRVVAVPPAVISGQTPNSSLAMRPPQNGAPQMVSRRHDGAPAPVIPRPRYVLDTAPPVGQRQLPLLPGEPTPKFRAAAATGGPLPVRKPTSEAATGSALAVPAPVVNVPALRPAIQPKVQPTPQPGLQPGSARPLPVYKALPPAVTVRSEPLLVPRHNESVPPVMTHRETGPEIRRPRNRGEAQPTPEVPFQPAPSTAAPIMVPHSATQQHPLATPETTRLKAKPAPLPAKPHPDNLDESSKGNKTEVRARTQSVKE